MTIDGMTTNLTEIEITPAMIEAGARVLYRFQTFTAGEEFWAEEVYLAMESAKLAASVEPHVPSAADLDRRRAIEAAVGALVTRRAGELSLAPELLLSRRQRDRALDVWGGRGSLAAALGGFRGALLGAELDALAPVGAS